MCAKPNIVWLASYPKSGNTWFRVFLSNLIAKKDEPVDINNLKKTPIASSRILFDDATAFNSSDLTMNEIDLMRPQVYKDLNKSLTNLMFIKVHDALTKNGKGEYLFPPEVSKGAIYLVRNPLDVAVSFAHHSATTIEKTIHNMNDANYAFCYRNDRLQNQLMQYLNNWSGHVESWINQEAIPVHIMRYEDMKATTFETFRAAVDFIGLNVDDERIQKAIDFSRFERLKNQEEQKGFCEKAPAAKSFFRKGEVGDHKNVLTQEQVDKIIECHRPMMEYFHYL